MGTFTDFLRRVGIQRDAAKHSATSSAGLADVEFRVSNMVCDGCAEKIDGVLQAIPGVREVRPNVPEKRIRVRYESARIDRQRLRDGLAAAGFTAVDADAP